MTPYVGDAALLASRAGPELAAAYRPIVLVPGANHGQTTGGGPNLPRGDIPSNADVNASTASLAEMVSAFLAAHESPEAADRQDGVQALLAGVRNTSRLLAPYLSLRGLTGTDAVWGGDGDNATDSGNGTNLELRGTRRQVGWLGGWVLG
jgi:hypothetical protein